MTASNNEPIFCSLDLELTGFDPTIDEILEVGFVFFSVSEGGVTIHDQWSQVFRPTKTVRSKILALTGINTTEIDNAPLFSEYHSFIQEKLGNAILVGHSISVDVRFLEASGVKVRQEFVDTLDLVQFLLPTHHSYNLENLMHYFGIPHPEAHRALADAKATVAVLDKLVKIFAFFPDELKKEMLAAIKQGNFAWEALFTDVKSSAQEAGAKAAVQTSGNDETSFELATNSIISLPLTPNLEDKIVQSALKADGKSLVVLENRNKVLEFFRQGIITPLFVATEMFNEENFRKFADRSLLTQTEILFVLKVLVWKYTNWQTITVSDINWTASGRQFKPYITNGGVPQDSDAKVLATDYETFWEMAKSPRFTSRHVVIESIDRFERFLSSGTGTRISWGRILGLLRSYYNPETDLGEPAYKTLVVQGIAATDLFFGLVGLLLKPQRSPVDLATLDAHINLKISRAAQHYLVTLGNIANGLKSKELADILVEFELFLQEDDEFVRWFEVSEYHCFLYARPISLYKENALLKASFPNITFVGELEPGELGKYYVKQLGLSDFLKKQQPILAPNLSIYISDNVLQKKDIVETTLLDLPTIVLFQSVEQLKTFYDEQYPDLTQAARVFALGYSGGTTKMFRNFAISEKSILLATPEFLYKQKLPKKIPVSHLFFIGLPQISLEHPFLKAQSVRFPEGVENFRKMLVLDYLYTILKCCNRSQLTRVTFANLNNGDKDQVLQFFAQLSNVVVKS